MRSGDYFFSRWKGRLIHSGIHILSHLRLLVRWVFYSVLMGILVGFIGIAFVYAIQWATGFRLGHWWVIGLLPLGGLLIVWLYRISHDQNDKGTNMVLASLRAETELPVQMAPLIFVSTVVTHFCGGSAGREGAALQLGGSVGSVIGRLFRLAERDKQVLMLCGMSAAFSAIFRTPIAAPVFAMEVVCVGAMRYAALVPCTIASLTASWLADRCGIPLAKYALGDLPAFRVVPALKILLLGVCCAAVSILFCILLHQTEHLLKKRCKNPYVRSKRCDLGAGAFGAKPGLSGHRRRSDAPGSCRRGGLVCVPGEDDLHRSDPGRRFQRRRDRAVVLYRCNLRLSLRASAGHFAVALCGGRHGGAVLRRDQLSACLYDDRSGAVRYGRRTVLSAGDRCQLSAVRLLWLIRRADLPGVQIYRRVCEP